MLCPRPRCSRSPSPDAARSAPARPTRRAPVGAQLTRLEAGCEPTGSLPGWPLILVLLGLAGLAAPLLRRRAR